jgi:hypothetical protein
MLSVRGIGFFLARHRLPLVTILLYALLQGEEIPNSSRRALENFGDRF